MGKRIGNIYNKITDLDNIIYMSKIVSKNTKNKYKVSKFNEWFSCNVIDIKNTLESRKYKPLKYNIFLITEPKVRLIMSQNIKDKIINHLVSYYCLSYLDKSFIDTNVATRINRGTKMGLSLLKKYLNNDVKYYLKFDISKYFYNIDHDILKRLIRNKIKDKDALNIINNIIDSTNEKYINEEIMKIKYKEIPLYNKNKGLPIGNMTSQIMAIFYLNELDHFIKEKLKLKYYIRYML